MIDDNGGTEMLMSQSAVDERLGVPMPGSTEKSDKPAIERDMEVVAEVRPRMSAIQTIVAIAGVVIALITLFVLIGKE